jgi:predicted PurR-regulated permease PerM
LNDLPTIKRLLVAILLILLSGVVYFARDLFLPIMIAILLSLTLSPVVRAMERLRVPAPVSAVLLILGTATGLFVGAYMMSGPVTTLMADAPQMADELRDKLRGVLQSVQDVQEASDQVEELASGGADKNATVAIEQPSLVAFAAGSVANFLSLTVVGLVLSMFILASGDLFYTKIVEAAPTFSDKRKAVKTMRDIERQISQYFLTITSVNAALGVAIALAMALVGMPNPILWGALAFALNFLPFLGAIVGVIFAAGVGLLTFDTLGAGLLPAAIYLALTSIEGQFVTPHAIGRRLELNTVSVLLTVIIWSWLWNIPGALMAVPFLVLAKVMSDNIPAWSTFGSFLSARTPPLVAEIPEKDG